MRCFISISIPEKVKVEIIKIQNQLGGFFGKKTEEKNLHLTLKFLGEIDEDKIKEVQERLKKIKFEKLKLAFESVGVFSEKYIRIVWLSLVGAEELQKVIDYSLGDLFGLEKRFMGHLTIARIKNLQNKKKFLEDLGKIKFEKLSFDIDSFNLVESVLKPEGPEYKIIEKYVVNK